MKSENKLCPQRKIDKNDKFSSKTFTFKMINIYNKVNRELTLLKNNFKFKKCINKLSTNPNLKFKIPKQNDYNDDDIKKYSDEIFRQCYMI